MLTVDFDRLGLQPGDRMLDMGCGGGRHAFEAIRRGATVIAFDYSEGELKDVRGVIGAMGVAGEIPAGTEWGTVNGDALNLPFAGRLLRRDRRVRGARAPLGDRVGDDRARARAAAGRSHRGHRAERVPRAALLDRSTASYHDVPGGHVRIFKRKDLAEPAVERAASRSPATTTSTGCTRRTGGSAARVA